MIGSWVRFDDVLRFGEKLRQGYGPRIASLLLPRRAAARVTAAWRHTSAPAKGWGAIPAVRQRWNSLVSGDPETPHIEHFIHTYLGARAGLAAVSIGCGTGSRELDWARTGRIARLDGFDVSPPRIQAARERAEAEHLGDVLRFEVQDARRLRAPDASYDLFIAESALHHVSPLEDAVREIRRVLRPGGFLVLWDFVGPARFQWTDRQVEAVDGLLAMLPEHYRRRWGSGTLKRRFYRPGRLSMLLSDPSEAAESARILPLLDEHFTLLERKGLGGTVLQLLLDDIAHNFLSGDEETMRWLRLLFEAEDTLLATGELPHDLVFAVYASEIL